MASLSVTPPALTPTSSLRVVPVGVEQAEPSSLGESGLLGSGGGSNVEFMDLFVTKSNGGVSEQLSNQV
jgi:hypothetical protein